MKPRSRGRFPLKEAVQAVLVQARENRPPDPLSTARARALNAKARAQELSLARQERDLIPLAEAIEVMDEYCSTVRDTMDGISARVTRDIALRRKIEAEISVAHQRIAAKFSASAAELRQNTRDDDEEDAA